MSARRRILAALVIVLLALAVEVGQAIAATIEPAACNKIFAAGETVSCDVSPGAERVMIMLRQDGSTGATDFTAFVRGIDPSGQNTGILSRQTSAINAGGSFAAASCTTGTGMCVFGATDVVGLSIRLTLTNNTAVAREVHAEIHHEDTGGGGGSVGLTDAELRAAPVPVAVSNFPATQPVSGTVDVGNLPATQPVSGTVACSNCAGGGAGSVSEVSLTADDRERLDLSWWGTWTIAGFLLVLIAVPSWNAAWRFWRE